MAPEPTAAQLSTAPASVQVRRAADGFADALALVIDLLKKKEAGEKIEPAKEGPTPQVVNLMDALRASIDAEKKKAPAPSTQARRPAKKRASQK